MPAPQLEPSAVPSPGQVVTFQFGSMGPFGASFKVTPETTETELNVRKCFRINGTDGDLIVPQSVFPSLEHFRVSPRHGDWETGEGMGQRWAWWVPPELPERGRNGWEWGKCKARSKPSIVQGTAQLGARWH